MPDLDFDYSGLGEAYRVFSQKHARLLTVRDGLERPLAERVQQAEESLRAERASLVSEEREGRALGGGPASRASHLGLLEQHREWNSRVVRTLREMALAYAVAMLDAFLGRWREESG
jgi:hypothetical protein